MSRLSGVRLFAVIAGFLGITYTLCVLYGLAVPASYRMYAVWGGLLPGFQWLTWGSFFVGLGEVLGYSAYAAILYVLLRKVFVRRSSLA